MTNNMVEAVKNKQMGQYMKESIDMVLKKDMVFSIGLMGVIMKANL